MKVIVGFGEVKVLVPCGDGQMPVKELIEQSRQRYVKATRRNDPENIKVNYLAVAGFGGILDPDDVLVDVVDDKEQLIADFVDLVSEKAATSSDNQSSKTDSTNAETSTMGSQITSQASAEVKPDNHAASETNGATASKSNSNASSTVLESLSSSRVVPAAQPPKPKDNQIASQTLVLPRSARAHAHAHSKSQSAVSDGFERALSGRQSLGATASMQWLMAQQQAEERAAEAELLKQNADVRRVRIENNGRQLGIQVVPYYDQTTRGEIGFEVDAVIEGKRVHSEKLLQVGDRIVAINGRSLLGLPYETAQDIFCKALRLPVLELDVLDRSLSAPKDILPSTPSPSSYVAVAAASPVVLERMSQRDPANVRTLGTLQRIELTKTNESLGFSLTARDTNVSSDTLIYVKHIIAGGVAHRDGRLRVGDRLLEVNGVDVRQLQQAEVVNLLRAAPANSSVHLLVSRHNDAEAAVKRIPSAEVLKFDVPLGGMSLGLSVKARTLPVADNQMSRDLGIFVNAVIPNSAAQLDGRLRVDDRIVEINGASLLNRSNADAMNVLRQAMTENARSPTCFLTLIRTSNAESASSGSLRETIADADVVDAVDHSVATLADAEPEPPVDSFSRDAHARLSVSEKRHPGAKNVSPESTSPVNTPLLPGPPGPPSFPQNSTLLETSNGTSRDFDAQFHLASAPEPVLNYGNLAGPEAKGLWTPANAPVVVTPKKSSNGPIAPFDLDSDVTLQLSKMRGNTESFRLAVDRSHDAPYAHSKADRKAEKVKKAEKHDKQKASAQLTVEPNGTPSAHRKKKKGGETAPVAQTIEPQNRNAVASSSTTTVAQSTNEPSSSATQQSKPTVANPGPPSVRPFAPSATSNFVARPVLGEYHPVSQARPAAPTYRQSQANYAALPVASTTPKSRTSVPPNVTLSASMQPRPVVLRPPSVSAAPSNALLQTQRP